ncbi:MAG: 4Fe-4S dicluster domain-containing protein [Promethearchaeota archaeon]|jgi:Fe-S-cluster-containing hydrogenase component 2
MTDQIWIARDFLNCSGCRRCEVACSIHHEGKIWPEASRIRVFMLVPGVEIPHLCAQCDDAPCIDSCPVNALSVNEETGAILVDETCTACSNCIKACPGNIPTIHPTKKIALLCDLCDGDPRCTKVCLEGRYNTLWVAEKPENMSYKLYAKNPKIPTKELAHRLYGSISKELL